MHFFDGQCIILHGIQLVHMWGCGGVSVSVSVSVCMHAHVCVFVCTQVLLLGVFLCVCERERERERKDDHMSKTIIFWTWCFQGNGGDREDTKNKFLRNSQTGGSITQGRATSAEHGE